MSWVELRDYLHPKIYEYASNVWKAPTEVQLKAIPEVYLGKNIIISAPTGMGKTEAAMLPIMSRILESDLQGIQAVYIAPLRALVNNIFERLTVIGESVGISVGIRTGERKKLRGDIIVTTPESLSILVFGKNRDLLRNIRYVIVDEVHNSIYSDRGVYLSIVLEFLYEFLDERPQVVGLSATIPEPDKKYVISFVGAEEFIEVRTRSHPYFVLSESLDFQNNEKAICESITEIFSLDLRKYGLSGRLFPAIIFANSRRFTEYLATLLAMCVRGEFGVVHSDVKKRFREQYINKFEDGELTGIVATSALGEGVDFTVAKGVIQIASPGHPVYLRQRVGRARHKPGEIPVAGVISLSSLDLLENIAIVGLLLSDADVAFVKAINSISAIAKSILNALSSSFSFSSDKDKIIEVVSRSSLITNKDLPRKVFEALERDDIIIKDADGRYRINKRKWNNLYRRSKEEKSGDVLARAMRHFYTVIPFQSKYEVVIVEKWVKIGSLDPEFVSTRIRPLMAFQLAGRDLRVVKIDHFNMKVYVEEIDKAEKTVPFWLSPPIVRIQEVAEKMVDEEFLRRTYSRKEIIHIRPQLDKYFDELMTEISIVEEAMRKGIPVVVCDSDEGFSITVFYPAGEGGNRYAAYAISKYFQDVFGPWRQPDLKISPISFTLIWRMNPPTAKDFLEVIKRIREDNRDAVESVIGDYGRVEATLNQILDGIAMGAYRLQNLDDLAWEWIAEENYRRVLDRESGEELLSLIRTKNIVWLSENDVSFLLSGILRIPEEKMGYRAYREALKRKIVEILQLEEKPLSLSELASLTGYRRSQAVLYEMVYSLINERKIGVIYSPEGFELPAKVQIIIRGYGKTRQFPVYLPGKLLFKLGEDGAKLDNPIPIEPDLIELVIKADIKNAELVAKHTIDYIRRETRRILMELMDEMKKEGSVDPFKNIPTVKIIVEIPPPKAYIRKDIRRLEDIKGSWKEIKKYETY